MDNSKVTYEPTADGTIEVMYEGAQIAGIEHGNFDARSGSFDSSAVGFTISYGRGFEKSAWRPTMAAVKTWIERKADDLLDY